MAALLVGLGMLLVGQAETIGARPYEMDRAGRLENPNPPIADFESADGWTLELRDAEARFEITREKQLWGRYVGKLTYRATGNQPVVRLLAPEPRPCPDGFDTVSLWVWGNNWGWVSDATTPPVTLIALFRTADGTEVPIWAMWVNSQYWFLGYRKLNADQQAALARGAMFVGFEMRGGTNKEDRSLWLDDLSVFHEALEPLAHRPRPRRGIEPFAGQDQGLNTGPGRLPFPTRPETILPSNRTADYSNTVRREGEEFVFEYRGADGQLTYRYQPAAGTLDGLTATWAGRQGEFRPCVGGGVWLAGPAGPVAAESHEPLGVEFDGNAVRWAWRLRAGEVTVDATYIFRIWGKSLVIDVEAPGGGVAEVRYGRCAGLAEARAVQVPYCVYSPGRPMLLVAGQQEPLFLMGNTCWYRSNASVLFGSPGDEGGGVAYNGGSRYIPKTDGRRNDVYERFFVTVSPLLDEVLPTVPNPTSPYKPVTGRGVWHAFGAGNRESDAAFWRRAHRYGMRHLIITDHETMWRDAGESFTFRTRAAPEKGDDQGAFDYARIMQDELGLVYGPYNNYTDFSPVNEYWSPDRVVREPDGQLATAWPRCYAPKATYAVEACEALAPRIEEKFHFTTAYCDVHTAIPPWSRTDYDPRAPGAGTFAQVFYAWGEIMLLQRAAWGGPVYSEGNHHVFLHGLTDGNYAQDQNGQLYRRPWLVDFDLLKLHDLGCNFGMGNPGMFYSSGIDWGQTRESRDFVIDRFLAATVAYGHPGFLVFDGGFQNALRSYHMVQQLASAYTQSSIAETRYATGDRTLLDSSHAVSTGAFERSQVVNRYADGTVTAANGSLTERMVVEVDGRLLDLPPAGYTGWTRDGAVEVFAGEVDGHRIDYAVTPEYLYLDGRGQFVRLPRAAGDGQAVCRRDGDGWELIPYGEGECGFDLGGSASATALNEAGDDIGPAEVRFCRGLVWVVPVEGAVSYRLAPAPAPDVQLACDRQRVIAGEVVTVRGGTEQQHHIEPNATPGQRLYIEQDGAWIDFAVVPLCGLDAAVQADSLTLRLSANVAEPVEARVSIAGGPSVAAALRPGGATTVGLPLPPAATEGLLPLELTIEAGELRQKASWIVRTVLGPKPLGVVPWEHVPGIRLRGAGDVWTLAGTGAQCHDAAVSCGGVEHPGLFMHPPYMGGVGYTFARLQLAVPAEPCVFRCLVGKRDGSDLGDGILFRVLVVDRTGRETEVGRHVVARHAWEPLEADLTPWQGELVDLRLVADVGKADDSTGDWAGWSEARLESPSEVLQRSLETDDGRLATEAGPMPVAGLTTADLRAARAAWLVFDGCGLEGSDAYPTAATLNGVACGRLPGAHGDEAQGIWDEGLRLALSAEAIATLGPRCRLVLENPAGDFFKVRRFYLELELADGRRATSRVSTAAYTQPPEWRYFEGIGVPAGSPIALEIWFETVE